MLNGRRVVKVITSRHRCLFAEGVAQDPHLLEPHHVAYFPQDGIHDPRVRKDQLLVAQTFPGELVRAREALRSSRRAAGVIEPFPNTILMSPRCLSIEHRVRLTAAYEDSSANVLVALHARRSHPSIRRFRERHPDENGRRGGRCCGS
jgi:hypothetical protein